MGRENRKHSADKQTEINSLRLHHTMMEEIKCQFYDFLSHFGIISLCYIMFHEFGRSRFTTLIPQKVVTLCGTNLNKHKVFKVQTEKLYCFYLSKYIYFWSPWKATCRPTSALYQTGRRVAVQHAPVNVQWSKFPKKLYIWKNRFQVQWSNHSEQFYNI